MMLAVRDVLDLRSSLLTWCDGCPSRRTCFRNHVHQYLPVNGFVLCIDADTLPLLTLPYATYQAQSYDSTNDIYIFANIRFAAPPLGDLRWAPPAEPLTESGIQNGSIGGTCYQSAPTEAISSVFPC